jgi:dsDNA-specific endonuclease/ATPase MutS2
MKHVISGADADFVRSFTNTEELAEMIPAKVTPYLTAAQDEREWQKQEIETLGKFSERGSIKRIATNIPMPILAAIQQIDPDFGRGRGVGREKFLRWLKEHPEWDATGKVGR